MKAEGKSFSLYGNNRPKVLLLGNGINRAFGDASWEEFISSVQDTEKFPLPHDRYILPMGLKASMLSGGHLKEKLRGKHKNEYLNNQDKLREMLTRLLLLDFDYILTTNYSYEAEMALCNKSKITDREIMKTMSYTEGEGPETRYFLHTYNEIKTDRGPRQIWHIHGECRKPDSIVLGQFYYGNLLYRYNEILENNLYLYKRNIKYRKDQKINSWIEAFILGDVYIVGLGMDFAETDLWWLLEKKYVQEKGISGKTVFYEPERNYTQNCIYNKKSACPEKEGYTDENACKLMLMENYEAECRSLNCVISDGSEYIDFYNKVYEDLCRNPELCGQV